MGMKLDHITLTRSWMSVRESAAYIGVSPQTIRNLIHAGTLSKHKLGPHPTSRVLISKAELDAFVEGCVQTV